MQQALEKIPLALRKQFKINYALAFKNDQVFTFVSTGRKWGVLIKDADNHFKVIVNPNYDSTGYEAQKDLIVAVKYKDPKSSSIGNSVFYLYDLKGKLHVTFLDIDTIQFDQNKNIIIQKNRKCGLLDDAFNLIIDFEYAALRSIAKDIFKAQKFDLDLQTYQTSNHTFNGIINANNEVLGSFHPVTEIFDYLYLDQVIIYEDWRYFSYHIYTSEKSILPFEKIIPPDYLPPAPIYRTICDLVDLDPPIFSSSSNISFEPSIDHFKGKWGLIYPNGAVLIPNIYDHIELLFGPYFKVAIGELVVDYKEEENELMAKGFKWGIIDTQHNIVLDLEYDWIYIDEKTIKVYANKGGTLRFDFKEHSADWRVYDGVDEVVDLVVLSK